MCYKDKTFCSFYLECKNGHNCTAALTDKVREDAKKWWGNDNAPIMEYIYKPECFKEIENKDED